MIPTFRTTDVEKPLAKAHVDLEDQNAAVVDSIAVPELDADVAFEVGLLLDQYDLLEP